MLRYHEFELIQNR